MKAFVSSLQWHTGELPPQLESVLVLAADNDVGEAFHNGTLWHWSDGHEIPEVVAWASLPAAEELRELSAWFHALHS